MGRKRKKKNYRLYYILAVMFILGVIVVSDPRFTGMTIKETNTEKSASIKTALQFMGNGDFPRDTEGAVVFTVNFSKLIKEEPADFLLFLRSVTVPGIQIGYDTVEQKFYAGQPMMKTSSIDIFDGKNHILAYRFCTYSAKQILYLDNNILAQTPYTAERVTDLLASFTAYPTWLAVPSKQQLSMQFY